MKKMLLYNVKSNSVTITFLILCTFFIIVSKQPAAFILTEIVSRLDRNAILILSLLVPVLCGMGLNFSLCIGAMAGEIGLLFITHMHIDGIPGMLAAFSIATVLGILFGYLTGLLFNKTKGQEMITGMILGFFSLGLFDLTFIYLMGSIIPLKSPEMMLDTGVGFRNTIEFRAGTKQVIDKLWAMPLADCLLYLFAIFFLVLVAKTAYQMLKNKKPFKSTLKVKELALFAIVGSVVVLSKVNLTFKFLLAFTVIPVASFILIGLVCLLIVFITRTKLGHDIETVGQNMHVASSAGINVNRTRIISIIISTVIAGWGQIMYLQNIGNINTYSSHEQVGTYAIAALLVGGASITKATIPQVFIGTILFHILFFISPLAGKALFNDPLIGEYFRQSVCYGVIAVALALYAWQIVARKKKELEEA